MKCKSEEFYHFKNFAAMIRNVFLATIMVLQSDNATEYVINILSTFFLELGIKQRHFYSHTPQHDRLVERKHCHIATFIHALLHTAGLPHHL